MTYSRNNFFSFLQGDESGAMLLGKEKGEKRFPIHTTEEEGEKEE
jgi:hypothetical protein